MCLKVGTAAVLSKRLITVWVPSLCERTVKHALDRTVRDNQIIKCAAFQKRHQQVYNKIILQNEV